MRLFIVVAVLVCVIVVVTKSTMTTTSTNVQEEAPVAQVEKATAKAATRFRRGHDKISTEKARSLASLSSLAGRKTKRTTLDELIDDESTRPIFSAIQDSFNSRFDEKIEDLRECMADLSGPQQERLEFNLLFDVQSNGQTATINDSDADEWPSRFDQRHKDCWKNLTKGFSFSASVPFDLLVSYPIVWITPRQHALR